LPGVVRRTEITMKTVGSVLLVHNEPDAFRGLEETLHEQQIRTSHAHQCAEAESMLRETGPVDLVLTDVAMPDGTWKDVIRLARALRKNTPVIVMSRVVSMKLYLDTQDAGASDFIVPPMTPRDLAYALTTAMHWTARPPAKRAPVRARHDQRSQPPVR
jgi:DNA-binding NtrC family response regulator